MAEIFVMKRRAGIEYIIPVYNRSFIEIPIVNNIDPEVADKLEAILEVEQV